MRKQQMQSLLLNSNWNETKYENSLCEKTTTQDKDDLLDKYFEDKKLLDKSEIIIVQFTKKDDDTNSWEIAEVNSEEFEIDSVYTEKATKTQQIIDIPNIGVQNCPKIHMSPDQIARYLKYLAKQFNLEKIDPQEAKEESSEKSYSIESIDSNLEAAGKIGEFTDKPDAYIYFLSNILLYSIKKYFAVE